MRADTQAGYAHDLIPPMLAWEFAGIDSEIDDELTDEISPVVVLNAPASGGIAKPHVADAASA
eukprot:3905067-Karenia_brevis.AAC.1